MRKNVHYLNKNFNEKITLEAAEEFTPKAFRNKKQSSV